MNTIKNIWHILASLLFIIFCSCASASSFTSDYNQKSDLYYYGKTSGNINQHFMCYLNVKEIHNLINLQLFIFMFSKLIQIIKLNKVEIKIIINI